MAITINKAAVRRALEQWFIAARAGETMGARETAELSALEAAANSSDFFYQLLCDDEDTVPHATADEVKLVAAEDIQKGAVLVADYTGLVYELESDRWTEVKPDEVAVEPEHPPETAVEPDADPADTFF